MILMEMRVTMKDKRVTRVMTVMRITIAVRIMTAMTAMTAMRTVTAVIPEGKSYTALPPITNRTVIYFLRVDLQIEMRCRW